MSGCSFLRGCLTLVPSPEEKGLESRSGLKEQLTKVRTLPQPPQTQYLHAESKGVIIKIKLFLRCA